MSRTIDKGLLFENYGGLRISKAAKQINGVECDGVYAIDVFTDCDHYFFQQLLEAGDRIFCNKTDNRINTRLLIFANNDSDDDSDEKDVMNKSQFFQSLETTFNTCLETAKKKNQDYAGEGDPFANFSRVEKFGICTVEQGILVRTTDKLARVSNLIGSGKDPAVVDESIDDTLLDAINYLAILKAYRESHP